MITTSGKPYSSSTSVSKITPPRLKRRSNIFSPINIFWVGMANLQAASAEGASSPASNLFFDLSSSSGANSTSDNDGSFPKWAYPLAIIGTVIIVTIACFSCNQKRLEYCNDFFWGDDEVHPVRPDEIT